MGKGGGGTQVVKNEIPEWLEQPVQENIDRAQQISNIGHVPYSGPDVAAFNPMQTAAMQNTNDMAGAFGMAAQPMSMPKPQTFAGGIQGYSSAPLYEQAVNSVKQDRPGQYEAIMGQFINPVTGAAPSAGPWGPQPVAQAPAGQAAEAPKVPTDVYGSKVPAWKLER
ncbi:hypothetical protein [Phaeobacter inhibens]|uniref:hypothetical protein n=1 Tax=Phaeobacter inhibens TaxID=221822 RepID=UPI000C9CDC1D|nr:hypothetical protein [Phaeobacter inhibens]AUQ64433.1 hypothetical protein PhaeoP51_03502 [Phaeobacter inhibens]